MSHTRDDELAIQAAHLKQRLDAADDVATPTLSPGENALARMRSAQLVVEAVRAINRGDTECAERAADELRIRGLDATADAIESHDDDVLFDEEEKEIIPERDYYSEIDLYYIALRFDEHTDLDQPRLTGVVTKREVRKDLSRASSQALRAFMASSAYNDPQPADWQRQEDSPVPDSQRRRDVAAVHQQKTNKNTLTR